MGKRKNPTNSAPKKNARVRSKPDPKPRLLAALAETGNITRACELAGVDRRTFYDWRDADPAFRQAVRDAFEAATDALEAEARRRAFDGLLQKKFTKGGEPVIDPATDEQYFEREYSDTLLIFLLKAHRPHKFRERFEVKHKGKLRHQHAAEALTDDQLAAIIAAGGGAGAEPPPPGPP